MCISVFSKARANFQREKGIASPVVFSHRLGRFTGRLGEGTKMKCLQQKISISRVVEREDEIWNDNNNNNCHSSGAIHQKTGKITKPENTDATLIHLREDINEKKTFSFGHCPNPLNPPPMTPIRATWSFFFGRQKRRFSAYYRTKERWLRQWCEW